MDKTMKRVTVCQSTGCVAGGGVEVYKKFAEEITRQGFILIENPKDALEYTDKSNLIYLTKSGCFGFCAEGPLVTVMPDDIFYTRVSPEHVDDIVKRTLKENELIDDLLYTDPETGKKCKGKYDILDR